MIDFKQVAEYHDRQMFQALASPPPLFGDRLPWTRFQRWYWDNLVAGDQSWRPDPYADRPGYQEAWKPE